MKKSFNHYSLDWDDSIKILSKLQLRLYKCILTHNFKRALTFQKLIIISKSSRLIAIREMTQKDTNKNVSGLDGKTCLSFTERFQLNEHLKLNICNWFPNPIKCTNMIRKDGRKDVIYISTISDRCWQCLVKFCLEPAHEANFNIRNLGYRQQIQIHQVQKLISINLCSQSYGKQKRILHLNLEEFFNELNFTYLLRKLILPRSLKLGIFRSLNLGFKIMFSKNINIVTGTSDLSSLLSNVILDGIENIHSCIHFGYDIVFFLKPLHNEIIISNKLISFLSRIGNTVKLKFKILPTTSGFDFLGWNFRISQLGKVLIVPSFYNYQNFIFRVKHIINNSNYGAVRI